MNPNSRSRDALIAQRQQSITNFSLTRQEFFRRLSYVLRKRVQTRTQSVKRTSHQPQHSVIQPMAIEIRERLRRKVLHLRTATQCAMQLCRADPQQVSNVFEI